MALMTKKDVARELHVSERTVDRMVETKALSALRFGTGQKKKTLRFEPSEIERLKRNSADQGRSPSTRQRRTSTTYRGQNLRHYR